MIGGINRCRRVFLMLLVAWAAEDSRPANAVTVAEYVERLERCSDRIAAATGSKTPESLAAALTRCEADLEQLVVDDEGRRIEVRNDWISPLLALAEDDPDSCGAARREALTRLEAMRAEVTRPVMLEPPSDASDVLTDVLSRPEFSFRRPSEEESWWIEWFRRRLEDLGEAVAGFLESVFERLEDWLGFLVPDEMGGDIGTGLGRALLFLLGVIALGLVIYAVTKMAISFRRRVSGRETFSDHEEIIELPRPEELISRAVFLKDQGEWRQAIRFVYLALLAFLEDQGLVRYDRSKTNWEYAQELGGAYPERDRFVDLTRSFDRTWYGMGGATADDYAEFHSEFEQIVRQEGES